jgi:exodeoxyribonuclease VII small subunit
MPEHMPDREPGAPPPPANFEAAIDELEKIVERMETGNLSLEDSLAGHKRGLELARFCQGVLARAQQQVRVLEQDTLKALSEVPRDE